MNTITIGVAALAIAGGILFIRNRRRSASLDEASSESVAALNGASTLSSPAEPDVAGKTMRSNSARSSESTE